MCLKRMCIHLNVGYVRCLTQCSYPALILVLWSPCPDKAKTLGQWLRSRGLSQHPLDQQETSSFLPCHTVVVEQVPMLWLLFSRLSQAALQAFLFEISPGKNQASVSRAYTLSSKNLVITLHSTATLEWVSDFLQLRAYGW